MEVDKAVLGIVDYIIFALTLLISAAIGVYFRFSGGKQQTTEEFLLAGQDMSILPVAFSLMASMLSAVAVVGTVAEMYRFGIYMVYMNFGFMIAVVLMSYLALPIYFGMRSPTVYEYLERRFGKLLRTMTSLVFVLQTILYMAVVLYAPALALSAVTPLSTWVSVISVGVVCTFYCTLGGMKAVLWTDVFQGILMFLGLICILVKGFSDVGFVNVFKISYEGGRIVFPGFEVDPEVRYSVWNIALQSFILSLATFAGNQVQIQRMLTVKTISRARLCVLLSIPMGSTFFTLTCVSGLVIYAYYSKCDPMTSPIGPIDTADQLMPYYAMSTLSDYPGLPGLCICGIFSASLSTISSAVNSLTAVTMQDLVKPFFLSQGFSEKKIAISTQLITLFYGTLCIALTFVVATIDNLVQASMTVVGMLGGPVLAVFLLGMVTTRANEKGVIFGLICAIGLAAWISFGASAYAPPPETLPVSVEGCTSLNSTAEFYSLNSTFTTIASDDVTSSSFPFVSSLNSTTSTIQPDIVESESYKNIPPVYRISYMWFGPIGFGSSFVLGYIASIIFTLVTGESKVPPDDTLSPMLRYFMRKKPSDSGEKNGDLKMSSPVELQDFTPDGEIYKENQRF